MKAYRWSGPNSGLHLQDIPIPEPSTAEVLIQVETCGLCHSDCHIISGTGGSWIQQRPITLGHEVAGKVIALGEGVSEVNINDRVAVALVAPAGGIGLNYDGGYAEYAVVPVKYLEPIPDNVSFEQASIATDAVTTAYHAVVTTGGVTASTKVAIIGLGGLGSVGLRIASLQGATVYGFDIDGRKFEAAMRDGAKACFSSLEDAKDITFDVVVDFVGSTSTMTAALEAVKQSGRIVLTGLGDEKLALPTFSIVHKSVEIRGSLGGTKEELRTVLALISEGKITPDLEEVSFGKVNESLLRLEAGQTKGRLFIRPTLACVDSS
jgi:propanol-preferring alcohol dehydrogenase